MCLCGWERILEASFLVEFKSEEELAFSVSLPKHYEKLIKKEKIM